MKPKNLLTALIFVMTANLSHGQATNVKSDELEKEKLKLIQKLLSCQSMAYTVIAEQEYQTRLKYIDVGNKYYNDAYQSFIKIQGLYENMDKKLTEDIGIVLQLYAMSFESIDALNKPEMALALEFAKSILKKTMTDFYCK